MMLEQILVPLDGSRRSEQALRCAARLIEKPRGTVILLHAVPPSLSFGPPAEKAALQELQRARRYLKKRAGSLLRGVCRFELRVEEDEPSRSIARTATLEQVDLIVMAGRERVEGSGWPLASVALRVIRGTRTPVLLLRGGRFVPRRILVPLDGTDSWKPIMTHIGEFGGAVRPKVTLVNTGARRGPIPSRAMDVLARRGLPGKMIYRPGRMERKTLEAARDTGADVIALPCPADASGSSGPRGILMDSILRNSDVPVLLVPVGARALAATL